MTRSSFLLSLSLLMATVPVNAALPVVTSQPDVYRTFRGEAIRLPVATNTLLTRVDWSFNGRTISNQVNTTLYSANNKTTTTLVVPSATPANSGNYVAHLTNKDGTALSRTIAVTVSDEENPLESWKSVLPGTVGYRISSLSHLDGQFVAGAANSTIHVSSDGKQWRQADVPPNPLRAMAAQPRIRAILGHKGGYFAFTEADDLNNNGIGGWTSSDLLSWDFDPNLPRMRDFAVSNGQRMLVARYLPDYSRTLVSSVDGIAWEQAPASSPFRTSWPERLLVFKGSFFALTYSSTAPLYRSEDGVNWTNITTPVPDGFKNFTGFGQFVEFNGELLFFGYQRMWKSVDGIVWSEVVPNGSNPLGTVTPSAAFAGLGRVWISDFSGNCRNSSDLLNWQYLPYVNNSASPGIAVTGTQNVIVSSFNPSGVALTQDPGSNFTIFPADGITSTSGLAPTTAGIFAQTSPYVRFSEDGETWKKTNAFRYTISGGFETIAYGNGIYVRTNSTRRYVSWDGLAWREESQSGFYSDADLIFGNGRFVTLFPNFSSFDVSWSENGTTWSKKAAVQIKAKRLAYVNGRIWALAAGPSTGTGGSREYLYATSGDGESWQARSVPLTPDANLVNVSGLVEFAGRLILVSGDPAWWLASDDGGITWNRLNTGFGFLYNNPYSLNANSVGSPVIHNSWLFATSASGDMIASSDGRNFNRLDGPSGSMATQSGALFAATSGGVLRNGHISIPEIQTFGLAEGATPVRGGTSEIGIVITDYQAGDRIEFRINGELVQESSNFYVHFAWNVGVLDEQTLVVTVIRADGSRTSRSWTTGPAVEVRTQALPPELPTSGRFAFQQESAGFFYHMTPEGTLRRSTNLIDWSSETIPGLVNPSSSVINSMRIVTRADGTRLLSLRPGIWISAPGSGTWTAVENFPRALNGATYHAHPSGSHFTLLYKTVHVAPRPPELGGGGAYVNDLERFTSTDGLTWTSHGLLPSVGNYNGGFSDGTTILWIEDKGFDERAAALTPARLWRLTAAGASEVVELLPDLTPYKISFLGGKWIVLGTVVGDWELGIGDIPKILTSENSVTWVEGGTASPDVGLWEIAAYGNGLWIGRDSSGYFTTKDFQSWSPMQAFPSLPVWTGNRWVNSEPKGNGAIDHYESNDLIEWRLVSAEWPTKDSTILAVTGERLVTTLGKGLFTMDATGNWASISGRKDITSCQFWNNTWILAASDGGVGIVHEGVSEHWQYPLNAPQPISSSASEVVLGFLENGSELIAFSNRALYITTDGQSWSRREAPPNRSVADMVRLGDRLIVETSGKRIESSSDGGHTWTAAALPAGSVNYSTGPTSPSGPYGLYAENDSAYYIASYNQRYRSEDGETWVLLPSNTEAYLPRPIQVEQGVVRWTYSTMSGYYQWQFRPSPGQKATSLTSPVWGTTPQGGYYRGRMVSLPAAGPQLTPLANLQVNFPHQPGHTVQSGDVVQVAVEVRNTGFDRAWLDTPVFVDVSLHSGEILGSIELTGSISTGESVLRNVTLVLPRPVAGGRHHLVVRLRQDGGLPVDGVPEDDQAVSSEPLLRVPGSQLGIGSIFGGQLFLTQPSEGILALESGDTIEREAFATLLAVPDAGQRFVGWNDNSLGMDPQVAMAAVSVDELAAYFAPGPADYRDLVPNGGLPGEDADHDSTPNVIEFLLGSDPLGNGKRGWSIISNPQEGPCIEFTEQLGITSHSLAVSVSDDLLHWKKLGREHWRSVAQTPSSITWRVRLETGKRSFARLEAIEK